MRWSVLVVILLQFALIASAQTETARISGRVTDQTGAVIVNAQCKITDTETNISTFATTNEDGIYVILDLHPAMYELTVQEEGFRTVIQRNLQLYVQDAVNENFTLALSATSQNIVVLSDTAGLQTDSASVSTVVDDQFVQNMPLNGRSFQSLIGLAPGVVFTSSSEGAGQFSVNGQRSDSNYFMVDGVSADFGSAPGAALGESVGGALPGFTSGGGTNGLVSVDAMQEFRIQTSSYAPEFGRTPGAEISIVTKSGTNGFHGTAFDYVRNQIFDARNYFDAAPLPKPQLRQNDFGGTIGGPIKKDKTFFFFSYEELRLLLPETDLGDFYTASARVAVAPVYRPFVNAFPIPTGPLDDPTCDNITNPCTATLTATYSNPSNFNATSIRIDHNLTPKIRLFARYNHAPSYDADRNFEEVEYDHVNTDTLTVGATVALSPIMTNDFRGNWSRNTGSTTHTLTDFDGGVAPPNSVFFPPGSPYNFGSSQAVVDGIFDGTLYHNVQRQLNFVDTFDLSFGVHELKIGIDFRRLHPTSGGSINYSAGLGAAGFQALLLGTAGAVGRGDKYPYSVIINNYSLFAQDTWRITNHVTLTYGLRWELNPSPTSAMSTPLYAVHGIFDSDPLALVPGALWRTRFNNFAPRIGAAYQVNSKTVVRGGFGFFYDLGYGNIGDLSADYPYFQIIFDSFPSPGVPFDPTSLPFQPLPFPTTIPSGTGLGTSVNPKLLLPFTMQWNAAIERQLGTEQTLTATYVGSDGRRLLREDRILPPALNGNGSYAIWNGGYSHYEALQLQFQRRMSHSLQALVSYTLAKSSDLGSNDGTGIAATSLSGVVLPPLSPSDFDIRNSISAAVSYELPAPAWGRVGTSILKGWAVDGLVRVSSAPPIDVTFSNETSTIGFFQTQADVVPGQPYWIPDSTQPAGRALNPAAFSIPPVGPDGVDPLNGDFPRNSLRSPYSINQTDIALRRRFSLSEKFKLDIRAEYFNVFNHPMFGAPGANQPDTEFGVAGFGQVSGTANNGLGGGGASGGQNALYAPGGPRSGQLTVKLLF
jgi:Carboxypeptidase regulatory-like domain/TonB dependent receptor